MLRKILKNRLPLDSPSGSSNVFSTCINEINGEGGGRGNGNVSFKLIYAY